MTKRKKKSAKRIFLVFVFCVLVNGYIFYSVGSTLKQAYAIGKERDDLKDKLSVLIEEEEKLQVEANKLQDPDYVAKYAREKFLYSKDNEYVVKIKDED